MAFLCLGCKQTVKEDKAPEQGATEIVAATIDKGNVDPNEGWKVLFDGTSLDGWKTYNQQSPPEHWKIEDGALVFNPPANRAKGVSYNLVTTGEFDNFVLSLEWKISEAGNSGVMWGVQELEKFRQPYETGPEVQVLDNERHPDGKNGTSHQAGALYDMVSPSTDVTKPVGEWNTMVITIDYGNNKGNVVLNDVQVVDFQLANEVWNDMVSKSKFAGWEGFGKFSKGKLALQDHGDKVAFRNIKIKEL